MATRDRNERDREAVSRAILDAARELFVAEGYGNVSIRKIAERIQYSPAAIYSYFPSKDDIFFALAEEGFRLLGSPASPGVQAELEGLPPFDRLRAIFWHLYEFSRDHPQYFALMFVDRSVPRITREYDRFTFIHEIKQSVVDEIQRCIAAGALPAELDPLAVMRALSVGILGVGVMCLSSRLTSAENPDHLAANVLDLILGGLKAGVPIQPALGFCFDPSDAPAPTVEEHQE